MKISSLPFSAGAVSVFTLLLFSSAALIGCGVGELAGPAPVTPAPLSGRAMGGEQPIANGTVTLYSTTNNGVAQSAGFYAGTATSVWPQIDGRGGEYLTSRPTEAGRGGSRPELRPPQVGCGRPEYELIIAAQADPVPAGR